MKLAVVSMVRNETDIIGSFVQHLDALFDYAILMDHRSIDGTDAILAQACARRPGWTLWHLEPQGYQQARFTAFAAAYAMQTTDADFVFFLDADEFINVPDRTSLESALAAVTRPDHVGHLGWCNLLPDRLDARSFQLGETVWRPSGASALGKAIMPRPFYQAHMRDALLMNGNHGFYYPPDVAVPHVTVGELLHVPVRSHTQIKNKLVAGVFSVMAQSSRESVQCGHWFRILDRTADGTLSDDDLIGIVTRYGEAQDSGAPVSRMELADHGYRQCRMAVAAGRELAPVDLPNRIDPVQLIAAILRNYQMDTGAGNLVLDGNRVRLVA